MHAIEKILARHAGKQQVTAGEIVTVKIDFAEINDLYLQTIYSILFMKWAARKSGTTSAALLSLTIMPPARR